MNTMVDPNLSPGTAHLLTLGELHDASDASGKPALASALNPLHNIKTRLQVCVGEAVVTVGELLAAKEHQVFVLSQAVDQPVDILLEGNVVARGQLMAVDDQFAVRITELPLPLKP
jgi:flagellar motor switch protein FliN